MPGGTRTSLTEIASFLGGTALDGTRGWRLEPTSATGQSALRAYLLQSSDTCRPYGLAVLTLDGDRIDEIHSSATPPRQSGSVVRIRRAVEGDPDQDPPRTSRQVHPTAA